MLRRIAANRIILDDKQLKQHVIEIEGDIVKSYYPLSDELPFTEWLGGTITLTTGKDGAIRAYKDGKQLSQYIR